MNPLLVIGVLFLGAALLEKVTETKQGPCSYVARRSSDGHEEKLGGAGDNFTLSEIAQNLPSVRDRFLVNGFKLGAGHWNLLLRCHGHEDRIISGTTFG